MFKICREMYERLEGLILALNSQLRKGEISNGAADYIMFCTYPEIGWTIYKDLDDDFRIGFYKNRDDKNVHDAYNELRVFVEV